LFFLLSDGSIQSLPLADGNNNTSPSPVNVQLTAPIAAPLALNANFALSAQTPVPTPVSATTTTLSVPGATLLAAGPEQGENGHFYVVALGGNGVGPRILDLKMAAAPPAATSTSTTASRSPTPGGTVGGGLATQSASLYMTLVQQYAPSSALSNAKGVSVDPKGNGFYLLTQNGQSEATPQLVFVSLPLQKTCLP
jgi:hypothetical protein